MIGFIKGIVEYKTNEQIVVDVNGIGIEVFVSPMSELFMTADGEEILIYTVMIVREDDMRLYGFENQRDVRMFRLLLTVSGIGAKAAMAILTIMDAPNVARAIIAGDALAFSKAQGVGKKSAERVILELGDKDMSFAGEISSSRQIISGKSETLATMQAETIQILLSLGYTKSEAKKALDSIDEDAKNVETLVRLALRRM